MVKMVKMIKMGKAGCLCGVSLFQSRSRSLYSVVFKGRRVNVFHPSTRVLHPSPCQIQLICQVPELLATRQLLYWSLIFGNSNIREDGELRSVGYCAVGPNVATSWQIHSDSSRPTVNVSAYLCIRFPIPTLRNIT